MKPSRTGPWLCLLAADRIERGEMAGYLLVPNEKVPDTFNAGFSMYVAAWPLLKTYPGSRFQTGLFGAWMFAQQDTKPDFKSHPAGLEKLTPP